MFDDDGRLVAYTVRYRDKVNELNAWHVLKCVYCEPSQLLLYHFLYTSRVVQASIAC